MIFFGGGAVIVESITLPPTNTFLSSFSIYFLVICKVEYYICISFFLYSAPDPKLPFFPQSLLSKISVNFS